MASALLHRPSNPNGLPSERRGHPRIAFEVEVTLLSDSMFFAGLSGDISEGGIFVSTYREVPVGRPVSVAFRLPNGQAMVRGVVRWTRPASEGGVSPGVGIEFEALEDSERDLIRDFCKDRPPLYYELESQRAPAE